MLPLRINILNLYIYIDAHLFTEVYAIYLHTISISITTGMTTTPLSYTWLHLSSDVDDLFTRYFYSCCIVQRSVLFMRCTFVPSRSLYYR